MRKEKLGELGLHMDCFVLLRSKVLEGIGKYVAITIGMKSFNGRIMMGESIVIFLVHWEFIDEYTIFSSLICLARFIAKMGSVAGLVLFSSS